MPPEIVLKCVEGLLKIYHNQPIFLNGIMMSPMTEILYRSLSCNRTFLFCFHLSELHTLQQAEKDIHVHVNKTDEQIRP